MNHISVDIPVPDLSFTEIVVLFTCLFLVTLCFKMKAAIRNFREPRLRHEDIQGIINSHMDQHQQELMKESSAALFGEYQLGRVPPPRGKTGVEELLKGSDSHEGDPMKDKGGYLAPTFDKKGPDARPTHRKEFEAYIPSKDPIRIMEGKEENHFS